MKETVSDVLYGEYELEPVLSDLLATPEVQRLKDVHMAGPAYLLNPVWDETRYEHSLGVMLLIKKLGGSLAEQIAGLLHDVSHTAFSHLIDLVTANLQESYHEDVKQDFLSQSTLPQILDKHGYDWRELLLDDSRWGILEQEAPLLCADRIDYTLREIHRYFHVPLPEVHRFIADLAVDTEKGIVVSSVEQGEWFIRNYHHVVIDFFYDPLNIISHDIMAAVLTQALAKDMLTLADFMTTDTDLLQRLAATADPEISRQLARLSNVGTYDIVSQEEAYDIFQQKKLRHVDPLVRRSSRLVKTSDISPSAARAIQETLRRGSAGIYLRTADRTV